MNHTNSGLATFLTVAYLVGIKQKYSILEEYFLGTSESTSSC